MGIDGEVVDESDELLATTQKSKSNKIIMKTEKLDRIMTTTLIGKPMGHVISIQLPACTFLFLESSQSHSMQILLLSLLTVYSVSALPSKGKNKSKKKQEKHRGTKQQTKELIQYVKTHGPADPTRPSQLYTPGSLCKETDAAYIGSKMNYPRCKRFEFKLTQLACYLGKERQ